MNNVFNYSLMIKTTLQFLVVLLAVLGGVFLWEKAKTFSIFQELLEDDVLIEKLIDQVYQFSRMYWKSVSQQNIPVTIAYPEMVANIFSHFKQDYIPEFGKDNLWFL